MAEKVNVQVVPTAVTVSALARFGRTVLQLVVSFGLTIPIILNTPGVSGNAVLVKDLGIAGTVIATVVAIQNGLEKKGIITTLGGKPAVTIPVDVAPSTPLPVPEMKHPL